MLLATIIRRPWDFHFRYSCANATLLNHTKHRHLLAANTQFVFHFSFRLERATTTKLTPKGKHSIAIGHICPTKCTQPMDTIQLTGMEWLQNYSNTIVFVIRNYCVYMWVFTAYKHTHARTAYCVHNDSSSASLHFAIRNKQVVKHTHGAVWNQTFPISCVFGRNAKISLREFCGVRVRHAECIYYIYRFQINVFILAGGIVIGMHIAINWIDFGARNEWRPKLATMQWTRSA